VSRIVVVFIVDHCIALINIPHIFTNGVILVVLWAMLRVQRRGVERLRVVGLVVGLYSQGRKVIGQWRAKHNRKVTYIGINQIVQFTTNRYQCRRLDSIVQ